MSSLKLVGFKLEESTVVKASFGTMGALEPDESEAFFALLDGAGLKAKAALSSRTAGINVVVSKLLRSTNGSEA